MVAVFVVWSQNNKGTCQTREDCINNPDRIGCIRTYIPFDCEVLPQGAYACPIVPPSCSPGKNLANCASREDCDKSVSYVTCAIQEGEKVGTCQYLV